MVNAEKEYIPRISAVIQFTLTGKWSAFWKSLDIDFQCLALPYRNQIKVGFSYVKYKGGGS